MQSLQLGHTQSQAIFENSIGILPQSRSGQRRPAPASREIQRHRGRQYRADARLVDGAKDRILLRARWIAADQLGQGLIAAPRDAGSIEYLPEFLERPHGDPLADDLGDVFTRQLAVSLEREVESKLAFDDLHRPSQ